ncbi:MAG: long-chain-fatty-acid--CoA ligase [Chloroflexota bacterium]
MQVDGAVPQELQSPYDLKPWVKDYPSDVPATLEYPTHSIWELLEDTAARHGDKSAFVFRDHTMTFAQLRQHSEPMSAALSKVGVADGDIVLLVLPNVPHFPVAYYGALRLGAALAAAPPNAVEREIQYILSDSGARVIITLDLLFDKVAKLANSSDVDCIVVGTVADFFPWWVRLLARVSGKIPAPDIPVPYGGKIRAMKDFLASGASQVPAGHVTSDHVALLQYTGGTTGTPKAAVLTHGSLLANAVQMRGWFPRLRPSEETILAALPFFHVYGVTLVMHAGLLLGANTILIPRPIVADMFEAIRKYRPTIFPGVPTLYVAIINDSRAKDVDLSSIETCVCGGAPLPLELKREFERLTGGHLYEGYGLSEASPLTHAVLHDGRGKVGSMGMPVPDTEARIVGPDRKPVPVGEEGELSVRGPQVMQGYWRRPDETADVLHDGWLLTGDVARMDADGWFFIVDRKKDLIITGGENIYPREIEEVLFEHPGIQECAVVGVPHPFGGEIAKAFIVLKPGYQVSKSEIKQFASARLSKHKVPRSVEFRTELPKSAAQKVLRRVLVDEERVRQAARGGKKRSSGNEEPDLE